MATAPSSFGTTIAERAPSLTSLLQQASDTMSKQIRCAMPGIVQSFDSAKGTVVVQLAINDIARQKGILGPVIFKPLVDVPVKLYGAGSFTITVPIEEGDECLVVFADRCIDAWFQSGGVQNQVVPRVHSLSDGFALFGLRNQTRLLANYSADTLQIRNEDGSTLIDVADDAITVKTTTVTVNAQDVTATATGDVNIHADGDFSVSANGQINLVSAASNTMVDGKVFILHEHGGVQSGGSFTGPVA